ncbi:MAG: anti-sigma factor antagonist [Armatimonadota bacterium]|nr:anti-sigma factor antagonist [bacterium]
MAFTSDLKVEDSVAFITLTGELDASVAGQFKSIVEQAASAGPSKLVVYMDKLEFMASAGLRVLIFAKQKMGVGVSIYLIGCQELVKGTLEMSGFHQSVYMQDNYAEA